MIRIKKKYIIISVFSILVVLLFSPVQSCIQMFGIYYRFQSEINPAKDLIFKEESQASYVPLEFNETSRLFYLCKVWGFTKYYHENKNKRIPDVDSILIKNIPIAISCDDKNEFCNVLTNLISSIQTDTLSGKNPFPSMEDYALLNNQWMSDTICLNNTVKQQLIGLFTTHTGCDNDFVWNKTGTGSIRQSNEKDYTEFQSEEIRLLGLFRYWNMIYFFYPSKNYMDENWDHALYEAIPYFRKSRTEKDYRMAIYRLTNKLRDSHTSHPALIDTKVFGPYRPNFIMLNIKDTFVINKIKFPEENTEQFLQGDIILAIDGKNVQQLFDSLNVFVCGGNDWSNQTFVTPAMFAGNDSITQFTLLRDRDTLKINSKNQTAWNWTQKRASLNKKREKDVLYKWLTEDIAYLDLECVTPKNFNKNFKPIKNAKTIILDLRCYPHAYIIANIADEFVPPHSFFANATYADARFPGMLRQNKTSNEIGTPDYYKGHVIVLVNERTESFSEYLTMLIQTNPQTVVVGSPTSGADGNVSRLDFPGGVTTFYSGIGIYYPSMRRTQRIGVKIDHIVIPTIESIQKGTDIILEKAVHLAKLFDNGKN